MIVMVDLTLFIEWHNNREVLESQPHDKTTTTTSCIIHEKKMKELGNFPRTFGDWLDLKKRPTKQTIQFEFVCPCALYIG